MLKRTLALLILALAQTSCTVDEGGTFFEPFPLDPEARIEFERFRRELLTLEDIRVGDGPVAAWGRKISAQIEVRYADGSLIYQGPAHAYAGMNGTVMLHNNIRKSGLLSLQQLAIVLGLNGMAVGGKRRITISPNLVCYGGAIGDSTTEGANPNATCLLVEGDRANVKIRKEKLIVEATLTNSCIPVLLQIPLVYNDEFRCRDSEIPKRDPSAPIWHLYEASPSRSSALE